MRLLAAEESILAPCDDTTEAVRKNYPSASPVEMMPPTAVCPRPTAITAKEIHSAINGFPNGSARGPDGMRPSYFRELLRMLRGVDEKQVCELLGAFGEAMLAGNIPEAVYCTELTCLRFAKKLVV